MSKEINLMNLLYRDGFSNDMIMPSNRALINMKRLVTYIIGSLSYEFLKCIEVNLK